MLFSWPFCCLLLGFLHFAEKLYFWDVSFDFNVFVASLVLCLTLGMLREWWFNNCPPSTSLLQLFLWLT